MQLRRIHLFRSRREAFKGDGVLQENIIINCIKGSAKPSAPVCISLSEGLDDLDRPATFEAPLGRIIDVLDENAWLHLPESEDDLSVAAAIEALPNRLGDLDFAISTGPVVPFRATAHLSTDPASGQVVPLLWLQHVGHGTITWPITGGFRKPQYLKNSAGTKLRFANQNCVLLRRFSAKEDRRRLTAAPLERGHLPGDFFGIENHLNVIYGAREELHTLEVFGLAALLNSTLYDSYFRILSGNTQVSASEIRGMRLPPRAVIRRLGEIVKEQGVGSEDVAVSEVILVESR
jgi:adenine-specific DNA-methyltransferase